MLLRLFEYFISKASFKEYVGQLKMLYKRESFTFYLISLSIQSYNALSLEMLGNCTEDYEGQWFTCIKGSLGPIRLIFEIIVGKRRIRHTTTLKLNDDRIKIDWT